MKIIKQYLLILPGLLVGNSLFAQKKDLNIDSLKSVIKKEVESDLLKEKLESKSSYLIKFSKFDFKGYGVINYFNYGRYDSDLGIKDKIDLERLNFYLDYHFNDRLKLKTEIEFEHGGTGSTIELDAKEEFGEYEHEIEKGGEVQIEQAHLEYNLRPYLNFRLGRFKLYFNLAQKLDDPDEYFTTTRPEMEDTVLPLGWYETGISAFGSFLNQRISYDFAFVNGLDSSAFSSANWIKLGYQKKFEMVNAENFAFFGNVDFHFMKHKHTFVGASYYTGNTTNNRPKPDLAIPGNVTIYGAHFSYFEYPFRLTSQFIYGNLQNSEKISIRNANEPAALNVKKTAIGKNAIGFSAELGYDILPLFTKEFSEQNQMKLYPFIRYDYYDTMYRTAGNIKANKRWKRNALTAGFNWFILPQIILKAQYSTRRLGSDRVDIVTNDISGKEMENTFSLGLGFKF